MKKFSEHGFTAVDNRVFYLQEMLSPSAFSLLMRVYRMSEGYNKPCVALSNGYFQKMCNMSKNTVTKTVKELEDMGLLLTRRRARASTYYQISMNKVIEMFNAIQDSLSLAIEEVESLEVREEVVEENNIASEGFTEEVVPATIPKVEERNKIPFQEFWNTYDKKVDSAKCRNKWDKLTLTQQQLIMKHIPKYVESTKDKKYRKNPLTYLNGQCWNDEVVVYSNSKGSSKNANNQSNFKQSSEGQQLSYEERMQQQFNQLFS